MSAAVTVPVTIQTMTQMEYITYKRYLDDISTNVSQEKLVETQFSNLINANITSLSKNEGLKDRVSYINSVHEKLAVKSFSEENPSDCSPLAADLYNACQKTISIWNSLNNKDLCISTPVKEFKPVFSTLSSTQLADKKALDAYFELLQKYPKLKRTGDLNDFSKGAYQILYDKTEIQEVQTLVYQRVYAKLTSQGISPLQAAEQASHYSRVGMIQQDQFWIWMRDAVIAPSGFKHTYNRIVLTGDLNNVGGAATLPIITENDVQKISLVLIFRHAPGGGSWELEIPRGGSKPGEKPVETAARETKEETGYEGTVIELGEMNPDSGLTASIIPLFAGIINKETTVKYDKTESVKGKYSFTIEQVIEGFRLGYMIIMIDDTKTKVTLHDPFLAFALLSAYSRGIIKLQCNTEYNKQ